MIVIACVIDIFMIYLNFPLSTYEQFSDGENNTTSPEYVLMEVDQNQNDIEVPICIVPGPEPGCSKQVSSTFEQTPEVPGVPIRANKVLRCTVVYISGYLVKLLKK
ncbi:uncharacterized protein LOC143191157 isoform X1 [Rhynchophorus ferrugineus]|uniref:uncharacterized protein LOC143191157 isoform X1 n=1 Tax=Rhynchophorus ferrugineus TaxID=354439 RepID=UPI003FCC4602